MRRRVIVIGSGMGGLASAALLAARDCDVTVLESAAGPGGKIRHVTAGGAAIDAGPTVCTMRAVFDQIFADCGESLADHVAATKATILARHAWGDDRLDLFADPLASEDAIGLLAGAAEARGYRAFRAEAARIFTALDRPFLHDSRPDPIRLGWRMGLAGLPDYLTLRPYTSLWRALGGYFHDPRLRQLFARYATYCGSSPFAAPATLMLIAHVEASGVWLIDGGMSALATAVEQLGKRHGARYRYGAEVTEILVEHGRAAGVVLAGGERIGADAVICNAEPAALAEGRFGAAVTRAVNGLPPRRRSLGAMVWLASEAPRGFPLTRHNIFFSSDYPAEFAALSRGRLADAPSVYVCAQDRTEDRAPDGAERLQLIVNAPPTGDGPPLTPEEIDRCTRATQQTLSRSGLSLTLAPDTSTLLTPHDFARRFPSTGGALYGPASHGWAASFRRQGSRTRIPGLYCAGGSTHPGAGVPMAALSGQLAAATLLRDLASTFRSMPAAMPGGTSTRPATTVTTASPS